jgi:hypothetical protein
MVHGAWSSTLPIRRISPNSPKSPKTPWQTGDIGDIIRAVYEEAAREHIRQMIKDNGTSFQACPVIQKME